MMNRPVMHLFLVAIATLLMFQLSYAFVVQPTTFRHHRSSFALAFTPLSPEGTPGGVKPSPQPNAPPGAPPSTPQEPPIVLPNPPGTSNPPPVPMPGAEPGPMQI
ncbi:hypothetical protein MPSEU_000423200 [Mayamaea pseudoterrestris]|nr:hypothetical protein MPSEU_000423200 [Mayamaea pseudoterrestris]